MSDFQQAGVQHTPAITEEEMTATANIFAKMRDAVIDASHLATEVAELRKAVGDLRREVEVLRRDNHWLDEQLTNMRKSRDDAQDEAKSQSAARQIADESLANEVRSHDFTKATLTQSQQTLAQAQKERDDAQFRVMEVEDELAKVKAQLAKIKEALGVAANMVEMPKVQALEPAPEAPKAVGDWPRGGW